MHAIAVNGSYRAGGTTDRMLHAVVEGVRGAGHTVDVLELRTVTFSPCTNCMTCWKASDPDKRVAACTLQDGLTEWLHRMADADGLILASPVNIVTLTALFKMFQERCLVWYRLQPAPALVRMLTGMPEIPVARYRGKARPLLCLTSSFSPSGLGRWMMPCPKRQFQATAEMWGGRVRRMIWAGKRTEGGDLAEKVLADARASGAGMFPACKPG